MDDIVPKARSKYYDYLVHELRTSFHDPFLNDKIASAIEELYASLTDTYYLTKVALCKKSFAEDDVLQAHKVLNRAREVLKRSYKTSHKS